MFERIFICSLFSLINYFIIILIKKLLHKHISPKYQSFLWIPFIMILCTVFIPSHIINNFFNLFLFDQESNSVIYNGINHLSQETLINNQHIFQDLYISVQRLDYSMILSILKNIWLLGLFIGCFIFLFDYLKLKKEKRDYYFPSNETMNEFTSIKKQLKIKRNIDLYIKDGNFSPYSFGTFKPFIVIPNYLDQSLTQKDIEYILTHEIIHIKHFDSLLNLLLYGLKILYWFNPIVWVAFKQLRLDRELYCDYSLMEKFSQKDRIDYGHTILNCMENLQHQTHMITRFASSKRETTQRIQNIIHYSKDSFLKKIKSIIVMILMMCIVFVQVPFINSYASDDDYDSLLSAVEHIDLSSYFQGYDGTFVLFDMTSQKYQIYNESLARERVAPNSTYKIIDALLHLENGTITNDAHDLKWNGSQYPFEAWEHNQNLYSAMTNSVNWYFQNLDKSVGKDKIKEFLEKIHYGNSNIGNSLESYWLESTLKISPLEQVNVLKNLFEETSHFNKKNIELVKDTILISQSQNKNIYGKTGTGNINGHNVNGWFIGYIERSNKKYYFATYIKGEDNADGVLATDIAMSILNSKE